MTELRPAPGDFCVCDVGGPQGRLISLGERLCGSAFSQYQHAFLYVGDGKVVQAEPQGACERPLTPHSLELWSTGIITLSDSQRSMICAGATLLAKGKTGYSWLDYEAIALHHWRIPAPGLRGFIGTSRHMICSQLVDYCYMQASVHLFTDGRWPGYVTPADLAGVLEGVQ